MGRAQVTQHHHQSKRHNHACTQTTEERKLAVQLSSLRLRSSHVATCKLVSELVPLGCKSILRQEETSLIDQEPKQREHPCCGRQRDTHASWFAKQNILSRHNIHVRQTTNSSDVVSVSSETKVRTQMFDRAIEKPGAPSTLYYGANTPSSRSYLHTSLWVKRCTTPLCNKLHIMLHDETNLRKCTTWTQVVSLAIARKTRLTSYEPNLIQTESGTNCHIYRGRR